MLNRFIKFFAVLVSGIVLLSTTGYTQACKEKLIQQMNKHYPAGTEILNIMVAKKQRSFFTNWLDCENPSSSISTSIHESVHIISIDGNFYYTVNKQKLPRVVLADKVPAPKTIARFMPKNDIYVETYLLGEASSKDNLEFVLEELNAYTHDSRAGKALRVLDKEFFPSFNDGTLAMMNILSEYVKRVPFTLTPNQKDVVATIWKNAETEISKSCSDPNAITDLGRVHSAQICRSTGHMSKVGVVPQCSKLCK